MSNATLFPPPGHIVVATDFGPASDDAIRRALGLADRLGARISLLHVVEPLPVVSAWGDPGAVAWLGLEALLEAGDAALRRQVERHPALAVLGPGLFCRVGLPRRDLGALAAELDGDLLIVGARGERRLGDRLIGSTAQAAVHHTTLPLLVCRRPSGAPWASLIAATDFSAAAERAIHGAMHLAPKAAKRLLHVHAPLPEATVALMQPDPGQLELYAAAAEQEAVKRFEAECARHPEWLGEFRRGAAGDILLKEVAHHQADLVALGTRGHGPWIGSLLGSVSQRVLAHCEADVLLVPAPR